MMGIREDGREQVKLLVERFKDNYGEYKRANSDYNETQLRIDFLNPFLQALGWDVLNEKYAAWVACNSAVLSCFSKRLGKPSIARARHSFNWVG